MVDLQEHAKVIVSIYIVLFFIAFLSMSRGYDSATGYVGFGFTTSTAVVFQSSTFINATNIGLLYGGKWNPETKS